jgi:hypothetical protein
MRALALGAFLSAAAKPVTVMSVIVMSATVLSATVTPCVAQTILKTEPLSLAPYQSAYVSDSACGAGRVLRVTGAMRNLPRKKVCVTLGLEQASLSDRPF